MYRSKPNGWLKHIDFIFTDLLCVIAGLFIAYYVRMGSFSLFTDGRYLPLVFLYSLFHVFIAVFFGGYRDIVVRGYWKEFKATLTHNVLLLLLMVVFLFISKQSVIYSRIVICFSAATSFTLMYISRMTLKNLIAERRINTANSRIRTLIMANAEDIESTVSTVMSNHFRSTSVCGVVVCDENMIGQTVGGIPVVASGDTWKDYIVANVVDEVLINLEDTKTVGGYVSYITSVGATAHMVLRLDELKAPVKTVQELNGHTVISCSLNVATPRQRVIKRAIDIFFGLIGAVAVVIVTVLIGPLIYLEDKGPIFFTQKRVGRNGRIFRIIKFRTMYTDAEERKAELEKHNEMSGQIFKIKNDPRITRIGKFLRKTSIDELPQAFNILAGSMSVVGTRPPTVQEFLQYEPHHKVRLGITPGLTGLWQVSGRNKITDFNEIVRLDEEYICNWSLAMDFRIILKTFVVVLTHDGAE